MRATGADGQALVVGLGFQFDLCAGGQLANDIEQCAGGGGHGAFAADFRVGAVDSLDIEIGRGQLPFARAGLQQYVRQDWNGVAALDDVLHMREGIEEIAAFNGKFHLLVRPSPAPGAPVFLIKFTWLVRAGRAGGPRQNQPALQWRAG